MENTNQILLQILEAINQTNQRLDQTNQRLDQTNQRLDQTNQRLDQTRVELSERIDQTRVELSERIDQTRVELSERIQQTNQRVDQTNKNFADLKLTVERLEQQNLFADARAKATKESIDKLRYTIDLVIERFDYHVTQGPERELMLDLKRRVELLERRTSGAD